MGHLAKAIVDVAGFLFKILAFISLVPVLIFIAGYVWQTENALPGDNKKSIIFSILRKYPVLAKSRLAYFVLFFVFSLASWWLSMFLLNTVIGLHIKPGLLMNLINQKTVIDSMLLLVVYGYILTIGMIAILVPVQFLFENEE